ncbi:MAG: hypothetical protein ACI4M3_01555 [Acutalibacteraceae bacterium]
MKEKKKIPKKFKIIISIIIVIAVIFAYSGVTFAIDYAMISNDMTPMCAFYKNPMNDGGSCDYIGLFYKITKWNGYAYDEQGNHIGRNKGVEAFWGIDSYWKENDPDFPTTFVPDD